MAKENRIPTWTIPGVCTEARPLRTKKDNRIWAYSIKLMALGGIYELQTREEGVFKKFGEGGEYEASGTFDQFNGRMTFQVTNVRPIA